MRNTHQQIFQDCSHNFIGVPYDEKDCWQLVILFYKMILSIDLVQYNYKDPFDNEEIAALVITHRDKFIPVEVPQFGDIIVLRVFGFPSHLGIYLNESQILHTTDKTGSIIDQFSRWKTRVEGFYRYGQA